MKRLQVSSPTDPITFSLESVLFPKHSQSGSPDWECFVQKTSLLGTIRTAVPPCLIATGDPLVPVTEEIRLSLLLFSLATPRSIRFVSASIFHHTIDSLG